MQAPPNAISHVESCHSEYSTMFCYHWHHIMFSHGLWIPCQNGCWKRPVFFFLPWTYAQGHIHAQNLSHIKHHKKTKMLGFASNTPTGFWKDRCCREHTTQVHPHSPTGRTLTHLGPRSLHAGQYAGLLLPPCAPVSTVTHVNADTVLSQSKRCAHNHWNHHMHWCKLHQNIPCVPSINQCINIMQHNVLSPTLLHPCRTEPTSDMCTVATAIKPFHAQAPHNTISTHLCTQGQPDVTTPAGTVVTSDHHHRNKQNYIPSHFLRLLENRHAFSTFLQTWLVWQEKKHSCYASKFGQNCWTGGVTKIVQPLVNIQVTWMLWRWYFGSQLIFAS